MVSPNADHPGRLSWRTTARRTAALINTVADDPNPAAVRQVLLDHGEGDTRVTATDVGELRRAADLLRPVFAASDVGTAAARVNALLGEHAGPLRLTSHQGATAWHPHLDSDDDAPLGEWFLASSSLTLAVMIWDRQQPPGGLCAATGCGRVFLAVGNGPERRYCSRRCATRERVAAHRSRTGAEQRDAGVDQAIVRPG